MEKKFYAKPALLVEEFVPQDFVAACGPDVTYVTYEFWCDAGTWSLLGYTVWYDYGTIGEYDSNDVRLGSGYSPCNTTHSVTVPKGTSIDDIFPRGLIRKNSLLSEGDYIPVRIWRGENNNNIHCTTHLNESEYTDKNPS